MVQSRLNELVADKSVKRSASYINPNISSEDVNKLAIALKEGDEDTSARIIKANTNEQFLGRIFQVDGYKEFIDVLGKEIVNANSQKLTDETRNYAQAGIYKQIIPPLTEKKVYPVRNIQQKSIKGRTYNRAAPQKFSVAEQSYLKRSIKLGIPNKQISMNFNKYFKPRTASSILTKKRRLKRGGKR